MATAPVRYRSPDEDSGRWEGFPFRDGDIIISARSKSGTTWVQMICAMLIFQTPDLPAPLPELSPWLDWLVEPRSEVLARLSAQRHRRFIKTHTPLDGIPLDPRATYIVVARHPLDMAVSLYHQAANIDRDRLRALAGQPGRAPSQPPERRLLIHEWLLEWIDEDASPREQMDSLPGVIWHLSDAWARRHEPNVILVHYEELSAGLEAQMRHLAGLLEIDVSQERWPLLVDAAGFNHMRANASTLAPDRVGVLKDATAFFRTGATGSGKAELSDHELARYQARVAGMAPADLLTWVHDPLRTDSG
jgi:hypothetical protein